MKFDARSWTFSFKLLTSVLAILILLCATELVFLYQEFNHGKDQMMADNDTHDRLHPREMSQ